MSSGLWDEMGMVETYAVRTKRMGGVGQTWDQYLLESTQKICEGMVSLKYEVFMSVDMKMWLRGRRKEPHRKLYGIRRQEEDR